jgi:hypothetical protein
MQYTIADRFSSVSVVSDVEMARNEVCYPRRPKQSNPLTDDDWNRSSTAPSPKASHQALSHFRIAVPELDLQ